MAAASAATAAPTPTINQLRERASSLKGEAIALKKAGDTHGAMAKLRDSKAAEREVTQLLAATQGPEITPSPEPAPAALAPAPAPAPAPALTAICNHYVSICVYCVFRRSGRGASAGADPHPHPLPRPHPHSPLSVIIMYLYVFIVKFGARVRVGVRVRTRTRTCTRFRTRTGTPRYL